MPDISLLQPIVLRGVLEKFTTPETLTMLSKVPQTPWPFPTATWDVIRGSRTVARPNVPNSEAHIVPRLGRTQQSAAFIYLREKKVFEPTTLHWLRLSAASSVNDLATTQAEAAVLREIGDLNQRFDNFAEYLIWQALTGKIVLDFPDVQTTVDYQYLPSHKVTPTTPWGSATATQVVGDVRSWKRLIRRDGRVEAQDAYTTEVTIQAVFDAFARNSQTLLSDRMRDAYYAEGVLPGFLGLNWMAQENVFDAAGAAYGLNPTDPGQEQMFVADGAIVLGNFSDNRPIEVMVGPTADDEAPDGFTGKFAKTWKEKDPSARQYLLEWNLLPIITRPEQFIYAANVL